MHMEVGNNVYGEVIFSIDQSGSIRLSAAEVRNLCAILLELVTIAESAQGSSIGGSEPYNLRRVTL